MKIENCDFIRKGEIKALINRIASQKSVIRLSEDDLTYLLSETEIETWEYSTQEKGVNRINSIVNELEKLNECTVDGYHRLVLQLSFNPNHPLLTEELNTFHERLMEGMLVGKKHLWSLAEDESVPSLKLTLIMSRKAVANISYLLERYRFQELKRPLAELCNPDRLPILEESYETLKQLTPQLANEEIRIVSRWEGMYPLIDCNASVWDKENQTMTPMALYSDWGKLLSMPIYIDNDVRLAENELLAGLLCDMTYSIFQGK